MAALTPRRRHCNAQERLASYDAKVLQAQHLCKIRCHLPLVWSMWFTKAGTDCGPGCMRPRPNFQSHCHDSWKCIIFSKSHFCCVFVILVFKVIFLIAVFGVILGISLPVIVIVGVLCCGATVTCCVCCCRKKKNSRSQCRPRPPPPPPPPQLQLTVCRQSSLCPVLWGHWSFP